MAEKKLTPKQTLFVQFYLGEANGNATKAAELAGYSPRTAHQQGYENTLRPEIGQAIEAEQARRLKKAEVKASQVLAETSRFAFSDLIDAFNTDKASPQYGTIKDLVDMPEGIRRAIESIEFEELFDGEGEEKVKIGRTVKLKLWGKPKGLEMLGRHLKMWTDKVEHTVSESLAELLAKARTPAEPKK